MTTTERRWTYKRYIQACKQHLLDEKLGGGIEQDRRLAAANFTAADMVDDYEAALADLSAQLAAAQERIAELTARGWTMIGEFAKSEAQEWRQVGDLTFGDDEFSITFWADGHVNLADGRFIQLPPGVRLCRRRPAQEGTRPA